MILHDPSMTTVTGESPETIRFASHTLLDSYGIVVVDWKRMNSLRLKTRGIYRVHPRMLYRVHRPAAVIITLLLASGDIESNPGPVQYPCTVCQKPVKGDQRGIMCDGCSQWTHAQCGSVGEAEYLLLTADEKSQWFCPLCTQSVASLNLSGINNSFVSLQPKIVEVNTIQTNAKHPGVSETSLQNSGSHSEDRTKKRSAKNKNYYERHKARILLKRKQRYQDNTEVVKAAARVASKVNYKRNPEAKKDAARVASKVNYKRNPEAKKDAARVASKVNYKRNPEAKKDAARVASKVNYKRNPEAKKDAARVASKVNYKRNPEAKKDAARVASKINYKRNPEAKKDAARVASKVNYAKNPKKKIGYSNAYYARNKQSISAKKRDKYSLCEPKLAKIEMYLQEIEANLLENSKAKLALIKALKKKHKTQAEQARGVLGKTACRLAAKQLRLDQFRVWR